MADKWDDRPINFTPSESEKTYCRSKWNEFTTMTNEEFENYKQILIKVSKTKRGWYYD